MLGLGTERERARASERESSKGRATRKEGADSDQLEVAMLSPGVDFPGEREWERVAQKHYVPESPSPEGSFPLHSLTT